MTRNEQGRTQTGIWTIAGGMAMAALLVMSWGCGDDAASEGSASIPAVDTAQFLMDAEPDKVESITAVRDSAADGDEVVLVGRIGGGTHPWVEGVAAFTLIDESLPACGDSEDCNCPTPWDYCCETAETIAAHSAMIKFVDEDQKVLKIDAKTGFSLQELQAIVVEGIARRDDAGNLTVLARKMFVRK